MRRSAVCCRWSVGKRWDFAAEALVKAGGYTVDPPLSVAQFTLLEALYRANGGIISRAEIITAVWPTANPSGVSEEAVDGLIKRLRQRLRQVQAGQDYLQVVRGRGLRLLQPE
ncbi:MAG TPA: winged helix-turn-helix domain-containing protein [Chloroflexi bacterium]|nr:winged helix-turn-helix domain-containing protein [Chloroflexota bacterium]